MLRGIVGLLVHAQNDGHVLALGGGADQHLFGAASQVGPGLLGLGEEARGLDDQLHTHAAPGDGGRVLLGEDTHVLAVDHQIAAARFHGAGEAPVAGVVLQQVGVSRHVRDIVDGHHLKIVGVALQNGLEGLAPNPAKPIDSYLYSHFVLLPTAGRRLYE